MNKFAHLQFTAPNKNFVQKYITLIKDTLEKDDMMKDYIIASLPLLSAFMLPLLLAIANVIVF